MQPKISPTQAHIIKRIIGRRTAAYKILWSYSPFQESTWQYGGCYPCAQALRKFFRGSTLACVRSGSGIIQHIIVKLPNGMYLDSEGVQTGGNMIRKIERYEFLTGFYISSFTRLEMKTSEILTDRKLVKELENYIAKEYRKYTA